MKIARLAQPLIFLFLLVLTACGSPPLVRPEGQVAATEEATPTTEATVEATAAATEEAAPTVAPTEEATATPAPTEETPTETPPPTSETTAEPTTEPTTEPTATEEPTTAPTVESTATLTETIAVESTPPLTPTVTIAKEGGVTVGKYTFSPLQEVPDSLNSVQIMGWLPDSPDEIVDTFSDQIIAINVYTGQLREFSKVLDANPALSLLNNDRVAYATDDLQTQGINIWISGAEEKQAKVPLVQLTHLTLMTTPDGKNLFLYDIDSQEVKIINEDKTIRDGSSNISSILAPLTVLQETGEDGSTQVRYLWLSSASSPASRWTAVYNSNHFGLIDLTTEEVKEIVLNETRSLRIYAAYWSPDGQKLALLVTEGDLPIPYMKLFVLDIENWNLQEIKTDFQYVTNVTWAPDSQNLLISADTTAALDSEGDEYYTADLFLIDISSPKLQLVPVLPKGTQVGFVWKLSWAPDGKKIAIAAFVPNSNPQLYRIDVSTP